MNKSLRWLFPIAAPILAISMTAFLAACGGDDDPPDTTPAVLQSPADGATFAQGATVTLTFDKNPGTVTVNGNATEGSGKERTFKVTQAENNIAWDNGGAKTLTFTLTEPDTTPPALTGSTPADGATGVDPTVTSTNGVVLEFNEAISKAELMLSKDGDDQGWRPSIEGSTVTMVATGGAGLVNETTYMVSGSVEDASANSADVSISFTTKAKDD